MACTLFKYSISYLSFLCTFHWVAIKPERFLLMILHKYHGDTISRGSPHVQPSVHMQGTGWHQYHTLSSSEQRLDAGTEQGKGAAEKLICSLSFPWDPDPFSRNWEPNVWKILSLETLLVCTGKITPTTHFFTLSTYFTNDHILVPRVKEKNYFHWVLLCSQNK